MNLRLVDQITKAQLKTDVPYFEPGCTVKVSVKIQEGDKTRIQVFEGIVIAINGGGISKTFTVRKISAGVGVERIFPIHSPKLAYIEVLRHGKVRRAKLNFLRNIVGSYRIKERGQK